LAGFLKDRRDAIIARYLPAINPVVDVRMRDDLTLSFSNAAVDAGVAPAPQAYTAAWHQFHNLTGDASHIATTRAAGTSLPAPANLPTSTGSYIRVDIAAVGSADAWRSPSHVYFVRESGSWRLVGFERMPEGATANREP
jgi:hypothetical protein